jgi:hypothetical protein
MDRDLLVGVMLREIRERGWAVAVHNDYRQQGAPMTFWLFTKWDFAAKGEGDTDGIALADALKNIERIERQYCIDKEFTERKV